jgi:hypothetical protein
MSGVARSASPSPPALNRTLKLASSPSRSGNVTIAAHMARNERRSFGKLLVKHGIERVRFRV